MADPWKTTWFPSGVVTVSRAGMQPHYRVACAAPDCTGGCAQHRRTIAQQLQQHLNFIHRMSAIRADADMEIPKGGLIERQMRTPEPPWLGRAWRVDADTIVLTSGHRIEARGPFQESKPGQGDWKTCERIESITERAAMIGRLLEPVN
jgi:hypothetical protein